MIRHLYFHIPFCAKLCPYCCFYVETGRNNRKEFVDALLREVGLRAASFQIQPRTIYLGGGTPSALGVSQLDHLFRGLRERLDLSGLKEWTIEVNPATVSAEKARLLREHGVTRISMGVQSWDDEVLATLGRNHNRAQATKTFHELRAAGFDNLNIDLMFGVPGQTPRQWARTLANTVALQPEHISAYCLTYEQDTEYFRKLGRGEFRRNEDQEADFFETTMDVLGAKGYAHYEISNYAKPGFESAHNHAYWSGADYLGLGPSAFSTVGERRWQNVPDSARYMTQVSENALAETSAEQLDPALKRREAIAFGFRTKAGVPSAWLSETAAEVRKFHELGLIENIEDRYVLTRRGKLMADSVAEAFV